MPQPADARRRPALGAVLVWCGVTVLWWLALSLGAGRIVWFW